MNTSTRRLIPAAIAAALLGWNGASPYAAEDSGVTGLPEGARLPVSEEHTTTKLSPAGPRRVYVHDTVFPHAKDGKVWIIDGDQLKLEGILPAANWANFMVAPDHKTLLVSETHWAHGNRGARDDIVAFYDAATLDLVSEVKIPGRFIIVAKKPNLDTSIDGRYVYVYNMDPAQSVEIVDAQAKQYLASIEVPGCGLIFPFGSNKFSLLCADGSLATVTHDEAGKGTLTRSKPFHDAEHDPVFEHSATDKYKGMAYFLSYTGKVYPVKLGDQPEFQPAWSIQEAAGVEVATTSPQQLAWRPGGWQVSYLQRKSGHLYVLMHEGKFWTHKNSGTEVWVLDVNSKKLVKRIPLENPSQSISVSQEDDPRLFVITETVAFQVYSPQTGEKIGAIDKLGDSPQVMALSGD